MSGSTFPFLWHCLPVPLWPIRRPGHNGGVPGPRRFATDVEDVGALGGEPAGMLDRALRIKKPATVREAVRCDVDHTHDDWAATAKEPCQQAGRRLRVRAGGIR